MGFIHGSKVALARVDLEGLRSVYTGYCNSVTGLD